MVVSMVGAYSIYLPSYSTYMEMDYSLLSL